MVTNWSHLSHNYNEKVTSVMLGKKNSDLHTVQWIHSCSCELDTSDVVTVTCIFAMKVNIWQARLTLMLLFDMRVCTAFSPSWFMSSKEQRFHTDL